MIEDALHRDKASNREVGRVRAANWRFKMRGETDREEISEK
jgi:hypothetical protein